MSTNGFMSNLLKYNVKNITHHKHGSRMNSRLFFPQAMIEFALKMLTQKKLSREISGQLNIGYGLHGIVNPLKWMTQMRSTPIRHTRW